MRDVLMYWLYYWPFIVLTIGVIVFKVSEFLNPSEPIPNYRIKKITINLAVLCILYRDTTIITKWINMRIKTSSAL